MTEAEFDELIQHHEYQAQIWGDETVSHKYHTKWAAALRSLKDELRAIKDKISQFIGEEHSVT